MNRVHLRQEPGRTQRMSIQEGDDTLIHLSQHQAISNDAQLYTGGTYKSTGTNVLTLPTDGNMFRIEVVSGTAQLLGSAGETVDGVSNPVLTVGDTREYHKIGVDWMLQNSVASGAGLASTRVTANTIISAAFSVYWVDSASPVILTIPAGLPLDHIFWVVRPESSNAVTVVPTAPDTAINPETGLADSSGFRLNEPGNAIFTKLANGYHVNANQ